LFSFVCTGPGSDPFSPDPAAPLKQQQQQQADPEPASHWSPASSIEHLPNSAAHRKSKSKSDWKNSLPRPSAPPPTPSSVIAFLGFETDAKGTGKETSPTRNKDKDGSEPSSPILMRKEPPPPTLGKKRKSILSSMAYLHTLSLGLSKDKDKDKAKEGSVSAPGSASGSAPGSAHVTPAQSMPVTPLSPPSGPSSFMTSVSSGAVDNLRDKALPPTPGRSPSGTPSPRTSAEGVAKGNNSDAEHIEGSGDKIKEGGEGECLDFFSFLPFFLLCESTRRLWLWKHCFLKFEYVSSMCSVLMLDAYLSLCRYP
jgi:hypothetical protein